MELLTTIAYVLATLAMLLIVAGLVFARNRPPRDRTIRRIEQSRIPNTIFLAVVVVACIGILLALTFLAINIRFRNER